MDAVAMLHDHLGWGAVVRSDGGPLDVMDRELGDLACLSGLEVVAEHVEHVALLGAVVGQVVDLAAVPHGERVGALPVGDAARLARLEVDEPHVGGHAAAVALPGAVVGGVRRVGHPLAGAVDRAVGAIRDRQRRRQPALDRHGVEFLRAREALERRGHDDETLAIGRPVAEAFGRGVMRDALRDAAGHGKRVEIERLVVVRAEGDRLAVRREAGGALESRRTRDWCGHATLLGHDPKVVAVDEDDVGLGNVGIAAESAGEVGLGGRRQERGREGGRARAGEKGRHGAKW